MNEPNARRIGFQRDTTTPTARPSIEASEKPTNARLIVIAAALNRDPSRMPSARRGNTVSGPGKT